MLKDKYLKYRNKNTDDIHGGFNLSDSTTPYTFKHIINEHFSGKTIFDDVLQNNPITQSVQNNNCHKLFSTMASKDYSVIFDKLMKSYYITNTYNQTFHTDKREVISSSVIQNYHINFAALIFISFICEYELFSLLYSSINFNNITTRTNNDLKCIFAAREDACSKERIYKINNNEQTLNLIAEFTQKLDKIFNDFMANFINSLVILLVNQEINYNQVYECIVPIKHFQHVENTFDFIYTDWKDKISKLYTTNNPVIQHTYMINTINTLLHSNLRNISSEKQKYIAEGTGFFSFIFLERNDSEFSGSCITFTMIECYIMSRLHTHGKNINLLLENKNHPTPHNYWNFVQNKLLLKGGVSHWASNFSIYTSEDINGISLRSLYKVGQTKINFITDRRKFIEALILPVYDSYKIHIEQNAKKISKTHANMIFAFINHRIELLFPDLFQQIRHFDKYDYIHISTNGINEIYKGYSALYWAAQNGNVNAVKKLIASGADVNQQFSDKSTVISGAIMGNPMFGNTENNRIEIVKILLQHGVSPVNNDKPYIIDIQTSRFNTENAKFEFNKLLS
jgi:hypothetical protein